MNKKKVKILTIDDSPDTLEIIERNLTALGYDAYTAESAEEGLAVMESEEIDLVITDWKMPKINGLDLVRHVRGNFPDTEIMMVTGYATVEGAVEAIKTGAEEYLAKPFTEEELEAAVERALQKLHARRSGKLYKNKAYQYHGLIGCSPEMRKVFSLIDKTAPTPATVLISGESGTGKELAARAIHYNSPRSSEPFVTINCGAIPETLLESELFGYVRGAFTGADKSRAGFFQTADRGTIFLDEISETSLSMQIKLLRFLQEKEVCMVGSSKAMKVDVRVIAATNKDLQILMQKGLFREDLFYRLNVISLPIPPLRNRPGDISLLTHHFLDKYSQSFGKENLTISPKVIEAFEEYDWPGNVRELENLIQRLVIMTSGPAVEISDLPSTMHYSVATENSIGKTLAQIELDYIRRTLVFTKGNKTRAARILDIDRKTLRKKMQKKPG